MKIAFVVQRYGLEVNGGAELLCRLVAEHLSHYLEVDVITTCAIDYVTWRDEYVEGLSVINGVNVHRFSIDYPRNNDEFNKFSEYIFLHPHFEDDEIHWMKLQGPNSTKLLSFISNNKENYDFFIFIPYLYCTTYFALPLVKEKALLISAAHDEPPIYLSIFKHLFHSPKAFIFSTEEEKNLVHSYFHNENIIYEIIGTGINFPEWIDCEVPIKTYGNYISYLGRIDESKGCIELFQNFTSYKENTLNDIKLLLVGKPVIPIPSHPDIIYLGFLSDQEKFNILGGSKLLVMPSKYESLSMVLLEAWLCSVPVLVNGECEVLKGQCLRSNGGLWYRNYDEFTECLSVLLKYPELRIKLGENGKKYVHKNYSWNGIIDKYLSLFEKLK